MNSKLSKLLMSGAVLVAMTAQAAPAAFFHVTPFGDQQFAVVHPGMTQDEVRSAIGAPPMVAGGSRTGEAMWIYDFIDVWGYRSQYDIEFKDGVVTKTYSERTQEN